MRFVGAVHQVSEEMAETAKPADVAKVAKPAEGRPLASLAFRLNVSARSLVLLAFRVEAMAIGRRAFKRGMSNTRGAVSAFRDAWQTR